MIRDTTSLPERCSKLDSPVGLSYCLLRLPDEGGHPFERGQVKRRSPPIGVGLVRGAPPIGVEPMRSEALGKYFISHNAPLLAFPMGKRLGKYITAIRKLGRAFRAANDAGAPGTRLGKSITATPTPKPQRRTRGVLRHPDHLTSHRTRNRWCRTHGKRQPKQRRHKHHRP